MILALSAHICYLFFARRYIGKLLLRPQSVINILPSRAIYYIGARENRILLPAPANVIIMPHAQKNIFKQARV